MKSTAWLILLFFLLSGQLSAQEFTVQSRIDSTQIWIGQQTEVHFEITQRTHKRVQSPIFSGSIIDGLELVQQVKTDSTTSPDGHLVVLQSYVITSFYDSLYLIPAFPFVIDDDTVWSNPLSLKVIQPFVIDTASMQLADIKGVLKPQFNLWFWLKKMIPWMLGLILIAGIVFLIIYLLKNSKKEAPVVVVPRESAHLLALKQLDALKQEKPWMQGRYKEYHTALTDILREYIERVFEIPAPEMTSEELMSYLSMLKDENKNAWLAIRQILQLADLVKFAKWSPSPDEHELSLTNAILFVNETKVEEETKEDDIS